MEPKDDDGRIPVWEALLLCAGWALVNSAVGAVLALVAVWLDANGY